MAGSAPTVAEGDSGADDGFDFAGLRVEGAAWDGQCLRSLPPNRLATDQPAAAPTRFSALSHNLPFSRHPSLNRPPFFDEGLVWGNHSAVKFCCRSRLNHGLFNKRPGTIILAYRRFFFVPRAEAGEEGSRYMWVHRGVACELLLERTAGYQKDSTKFEKVKHLKKI